ncbi:hypothetical protein E2562_037639 [Oryza meyeriana var. granulata]|uniref:Uncharacterized protein n=1 Tax=Oryza meyeriana var. granulata TaxID=110450 RepID=A0A6G1CKS4_9ORYZ|nr:hypothetical protein E2562_037639 [Oryza meyeriana var. granulata]
MGDRRARLARVLPRRPPAHRARDQSAFPYRFQRTDLWKPVYKWLESLEIESLVTSKQISEWLTSNPQIMNRLVEKHSKYHLIHYTQRMHLKLLKKRGKIPKVSVQADLWVTMLL